MATVPLSSDNKGQINVPKSMIAVGDAVRGFVSSLQSEVSEAGLRYLRGCFEQPVCPPIDYEKYAIHFAYGYFLQNYWKACLTFLTHPPRIATRVLDAGAGSGASSLAYLAYLNSIVDNQFHLDLMFVDRSKTQMDLARKIVDSIKMHLSHVRVRCHFFQMDVRNLNLDFYPELILQGHLLTENIADVRSILSNMTNTVAEDGRIYVIERYHDLVWRSIQSCIPALAFPATFNTIDMHDSFVKSISEDLSTSPLNARFLVLRSPERKLLVKLIQNYFAAWKRQAPELLDHVFTPDAQYHEKPHEPPLRGIRAIKEYWKCKVASQKNIMINVKHYSYTSDDVTAEWVVTFDREGDQRRDVRGVLILRLDPHQGLISSLREYFITSNR